MIPPIDLSTVTITPKKMDELFKAPEKRALDEKIEIDFKVCANQLSMANGRHVV